MKKKKILDGRVIIGILQEYVGLVDYSVCGEEIRTRCFFHGGKNPRSLSINVRSSKMWCFKEKKWYGDVFDVIRWKKGCSYKEAIRVYDDFARRRLVDGQTEIRGLQKMGGRRKGEGKVKKKRKVNLPPNERCVRGTGEVCVPEYLKKRGISAECIRFFDIRMCYKGYYKNHLIVPIREHGEGRIVGYLARIMDSEVEIEKRYKNPSGFAIGNYIFNFFQTKNYSEIILVEGIFDVFKLWEYGYRNAVSCFGNELSKGQISILRKNKGIKKIKIMFDGDDPGTTGAKSVKEKLEKDKVVEIVSLPSGKDPDKLTKEEVFNLLNGKN